MKINSRFRMILALAVTLGMFCFAMCWVESNEMLHLTGSGHLKPSAAGDVNLHAQTKALVLELAGLATILLVLLIMIIDRQVRLEKMSKQISVCAQWLNKEFKLGDQRKPDFTMTGLHKALSQMSIELGESQRREKLLVNRSADVVCVVDSDGHIASVSPSVKESWGYSQLELEGRPLSAVFPPQDVERIMSRSARAGGSIDKLAFETQVKRRDGTLMDAAFTGHWSGTTGGLYALIHDISQQKGVEKSLRQSEQRLRSVLDLLPVAVVVADRYGEVEFANREAHSMLGYSSDELMGHKLPSIFKRDAAPEDVGTADRVEVTAYCKDGSTKPAEMWIAPLSVEKDEQRTLVAFLDKTAEHEFERVKQEFIAMVAHDLRSPLSTVLGMLTLLEEGVLGQLSEKGRQIAAGSYKECNRMLRLLNDMLELEKIETGRFQLQCTSINIADTVRDALQNVRHLGESKKLLLQTDLKDVKCWGDDQRLIQVLVNLLNNAIKYAPQGSMIRVGTMDFGPMVMVTVDDQGPGIPEEKLDKIFDKYEQVDLSDSRERGGTGLGLAICKAIVDQHGGQIAVDTAPGQGSRFWFTIPKEAQYASVWT
jgi:PAS domain S-box-containing protein